MADPEAHFGVNAIDGVDVLRERGRSSEGEREGDREQQPGQRVAAAVEGLISAEPVGTFALRGFARPVPVFAVGG